MEIKVLLYGNLAQMAGVSEMILTDVNDSVAVIELMHKKFPEFKNSKYAIALNKQIVNDKRDLCEGDELVFLPPFSGG